MGPISQSQAFAQVRAELVGPFLPTRAAGVPIGSGATAEQVRPIQEWLALSGHYKGQIDGNWGPQSKAALRAFTSGAEDQCSQASWILLTAPMRKAFALPPSAGTFERTIIVCAEQHLAAGARELGDPHYVQGNMGPWVRAYHGAASSQGAEWAWCASFATRVAMQAWESLGSEKRPLAQSMITASCDVLANKAAALGRLRPATGGIGDVGTLFVRRAGKPGDWDHAGIVIGVDGGQLVTVEGNTNAGGSREGVAVCRRKRSPAGLDLVTLAFDVPTLA